MPMQSKVRGAMSVWVCALWLAFSSVGHGNFGCEPDGQQAASSNESPLRSDQVVLPEASAPAAAVMTRELAREVGSVYDYFGFLRAVGDVDGDGTCDLAVFASSGENSSGVEIRSSRTGERIRKHSSGAGINRSSDVAYAGDVDGDGFDDYVLAATNRPLPVQQLLQCISGKTGDVLATRELRNGSGAVRLCGATVLPGRGASPVAYFSGSTYLILESTDLSTRTTIPMPIGARFDGVFADWGCDGTLDLIVLESLPGKLKHGLSIYSTANGELKGSIGKERLIEGPRMNRAQRDGRKQDRTISDWREGEAWGFALALSGNRLVLNGPVFNDLVVFDICKRRIEAEFEVFDGLGYLGGLLSIDDVDGDQVNDLYVWGDNHVLGMPVGGCSLISGASGERITPPELDRGDMFGVALARMDCPTDPGLLIFNGEEATLEFHSAATRERVWRSESLGANWSRARLAEMGDVDGDSHSDYLVSGLTAGSPGYQLSGRSSSKPLRATWSGALRLGGGAVVSGATGAVLGGAPGFGSYSMPAAGDGAEREFLLCLDPGPGKARLALWSPAGELDPWEVSVGEGVVVLEPILLPRETGAIACVFAVDKARMQTEFVAVSLTTREVLARETLRGVVTAALSDAAGTGLIATRILKARHWECTSELISIDLASSDANTQVLKAWGTEWGAATALARSDSKGHLAVGFPELQHVWDGGLEAMGATTSGEGTVTVYHQHQGRVAVLELAAEKLGRQVELDAPGTTRGFGEALCFLNRWGPTVGEVLVVGACSPIDEEGFGEVLIFASEEELVWTMRIVDSDS